MTSENAPILKADLTDLKNVFFFYFPILETISL